MRIAVPTDFSDSAKTAVQFAFAFARQTRAELVLLHVQPDLGPTLGTVPTDKMQHDMNEETLEKFRQLTAGLEAGDLTLRYEVEEGAAVDEVIKPFVKKQGIDCIIMGSEGASGLKKALIGSNTVDVIDNSPVPVIVVPERPNLSTIHQLVYASDLEHVADETRALVPFAKSLQALIRIVHVPSEKSPAGVDTAKLLDSLKEQTGYPQIELELIGGGDIVDTIEGYASSGNDLLLAMFTSRSSFSDQLFNKGIVREIALDNTVPLLVINHGAQGAQVHP